MSSQATQPTLTLYYKFGACSIAAHMLLLELSLPFTSIPLTEGPSWLYQGAPGTNLSREDWLAINPTGYVPALSVNGLVITELTAVLYYISSYCPERGMFGRTSTETAQVLEWLSYLSTTLNEYGFAGYWRPSRMVGEAASEEVEDAVRREGRKTILKGFAWIEGKLAGLGTRFAVGEGVTVVDFVLHTMWRWGVAGGFEMEEMCPRLERTVKEVEKLESVREALKREGVELQFP